MVNEDENGASSAVKDAAAGIAIEALSFVAGDSILFGRFLRLTGLELENLRQAADDPSFLAGVLDFILGDERTLMDFASQAGIAPERVAAARRILADGYAESHS